MRRRINEATRRERIDAIRRRSTDRISQAKERQEALMIERDKFVDELAEYGERTISGLLPTAINLLEDYHDVYNSNGSRIYNKFESAGCELKLNGDGGEIRLPIKSNATTYLIFDSDENDAYFIYDGSRQTLQGWFIDIANEIIDENSAWLPDDVAETSYLTRFEKEDSKRSFAEYVGNIVKEFNLFVTEVEKVIDEELDKLESFYND